MSEVYLAHDQELDRDVAFKVLKNQYASDEQFVERFKSEAKNAASLSHPNIVAIYDRGETEDGAYYIVMERVSGGTLKDRLLKEGPLPAPTAAALALQIARALQVAHEHGMIHRDIRPQNVLLTESGEAKVADFGIARAASSSTVTRTGFLTGTAYYISPEQALGQPASPQSDLYSLGVVLYEMLTGRVPYDAETPIGVAMKHVSGQPRPPKEANPDVPEGINAVTVRLLAREPEERYQSAAELVEDLERARQGQPPAFAIEENAGSTDAPVRPSADPEGSGGDGHPPSPGRKPEGPPAGPPPPARPGGDAGDGKPRRRRVPPWMLAAGLCGVVLLGVGIFLVGKFTSRGEQSSKPGYMLIKDDSGKLSVEVPYEWSDLDPTSWDFREGKIGLSLIASTDLDAWTWYSSSTGVEKASGMFFGVSSALLRAYPEDTVNQVLGIPEHDYSDICEYDNRYDYDDSVYEGKYDIWTNCGDTGTRLFVLAALPENQAPQHVLVIQIAARSEADLEAQKQILSTFKVSADNV
jgi:serine/threonine protein kinase